MDTEIVYSGRDNTIDLLLKADGSAVDLTAVTKIVLEVGGVTISDTDADADPIVWDPNVTGVTGKIIMKLGDQSIPAGDHRGKLIVYDASNPNGIRWRVSSRQRTIPIEVV